VLLAIWNGDRNFQIMRLSIETQDTLYPLSMKAAIGQILPEIAHKLCIWHIMDKVHEKVRSSLREDKEF
jgi:hypothetical protein